MMHAEEQLGRLCVLLCIRHEHLSHQTLCRQKNSPGNLWFSEDDEQLGKVPVPWINSLSSRPRSQR